jgi:hypothetical protein
MENLYSYLLWHNYLDQNWYAIPRDEQLLFFNGNKDKVIGVIKSSSIDTLIYMINNPNVTEQLDNTN